jgi:conjugative transfer region protein TrbK
VKACDAAGATGVILAAAALTALASAALSGGSGADSRREETAPAASRSAVLDRRRSLGEAGPRDPDCTAAWADQRRRFFGSDRPSAGETRP